MDIVFTIQSALQNYWPAILVVAYFSYRSYKIQKIKKMMPELIKQGAQIIDVRTAEEFKKDSNPQALNIPLDLLKSRLNKIRRTVPVVVCCASGSRSAFASRLLKAQGLQVFNAGKWQNTL